jgi:hypothetical protein
MRAGARIVCPRDMEPNLTFGVIYANGRNTDAALCACRNACEHSEKKDNFFHTIYYLRFIVSCLKFIGLLSMFFVHVLQVYVLFSQHRGCFQTQTFSIKQPLATIFYSSPIFIVSGFSFNISFHFFFWGRYIQKPKRELYLPTKRF